LPLSLFRDILAKEIFLGTYLASSFSGDRLTKKILGDILWALCFFGGILAAAFIQGQTCSPILFGDRLAKKIFLGRVLEYKIF